MKTLQKLRKWFFKAAFVFVLGASLIIKAIILAITFPLVVLLSMIRYGMRTWESIRLHLWAGSYLMNDQSDRLRDWFDKQTATDTEDSNAS